MTASKNFPTIAVLSVSHGLNDLYANFIPALLPFLVLAFGINATKAAILVSAFSLVSSFAQPFRYFLAKPGHRWLVHVGTSDGRLLSLRNDQKLPSLSLLSALPSGDGGVSSSGINHGRNVCASESVLLPFL